MQQEEKLLFNLEFPLWLFFQAVLRTQGDHYVFSHLVASATTVFRKAYILSGSGFHEFLYSIIESLKKNREIAEFIPNQLRFHEKKL